MNAIRRFIQLVICLVLPLGVGGLAGMLTRHNMNVFDTVKKPMLTPPAMVFPVVWFILYLIMGISSYLAIINSYDMHQAVAVVLPYIVQLILNFAWSIIFFNAQSYTGAFVCLILLWLMLIRTMLLFHIVSPLSSYMLIPYLIWVSFAGYLNLSIAILNK